MKKNIKNSAIQTSLILLFMLFTNVLQCESIDNLASAFKSIGSKKEQKKLTKEEELKKKQQAERLKKEQEEKDKKIKEDLEQEKKEISESALLGSWMLNHQPKKLIAHKNDVYQIKVLKQWKGDCWMHSFRNCLYIMDLVISTRKDFNTIYINMVDHDQYKAFTEHGCESKKSIIEKLNKDEFICKPNCTPENSAVYLEKLVILEYVAPFNKNELKQTKDLLETTEKNSISEQAAIDYVAISDEFNLRPKTIDRLVKLFHEFNKKKNDYFGVNISIKSIDHDITLVVHKNNNKIEYLFSDSNNVSFTGNNKTTINEKGKKIYYTMSDEEYDTWKNTFSAAIDQIKSFVENPEDFDNTILRMLYKEIMSDNFQYGKFSTYITNFYEKLNTYNLLNNNLYKLIYKNLFNDRIVQLLYDNAISYYNLQKNYNISGDKNYKGAGIENWKNIADFGANNLEPFYTNIKKYDLEKNTAYTSIYKQKYCNFIKQEQAIHYDKKHHDKLLKKISC